MNASPLARRAVVGLALVGAASLSGCSQVERSNEAARIGEVVVTTDEAQGLSREWNTVLGGQVTPGQIVYVLSLGRLADQIAPNIGQEVTLAGGLASMPKARAGSPALQETVRLNQLLKLNMQDLPSAPKFQQAMVDKLKSSPMSLNPRYGVIDWNSPQGPFVLDAPVPWIKGGGLAAQQQEQ